MISHVIIISYIALPHAHAHSRPQNPSCPLAGGAWVHDTRGSGDTRNSNLFIG